MKVVTVLGTRPEIIRLSRVMARLRATCEHKLVHTGQNYDYELNEIFFQELEVPKPDYFLDVDTSSLGRTLGTVISATEGVLTAERPDAVLVLGDTNSSLAAIMAKRLKITVFHMEAGNRCFDENVPEETNRRIVDHVADFNLAYTEHARRNLLAEGLHPRRVYVTGSPLREVLEHHRSQIEASDVLARLGAAAGQYFVASIHREENVDNPDNLRKVLDALEAVSASFGLPVLVSTHPRTRSRLAGLGATVPETVRFCPPFGFFDYNHLQLHSRCVLSDSGSVSEEAAILGFPAVTMRNAMERPEAMDTGSVIITGLDPEAVELAVRVVAADAAGARFPEVPADYTVRNCSQRVVNLIVGTAKLSRLWSGVVVNQPFWE